MSRRRAEDGFTDPSLRWRTSGCACFVLWDVSEWRFSHFVFLTVIFLRENEGILRNTCELFTSCFFFLRSAPARSYGGRGQIWMWRFNQCIFINIKVRGLKNFSDFNLKSSECFMRILMLDHRAKLRFPILFLYYDRMVESFFKVEKTNKAKIWTVLLTGVYIFGPSFCFCWLFWSLLDPKGFICELLGCCTDRTKRVFKWFTLTLSTL